jgi:hypothetical protein
MSEQRVSLFISHKIKFHARAAKRIKEILQSRTERLDAYICEDTAAGQEWLELIQQKLTDANTLLMLLPPSGTDVSWIKREISIFREAHPDGWVIPFKNPADPIPDFLKGLQVIDITEDNIFKFFLKPLFIGDPDTGLKLPLNSRITTGDMFFDARQIQEVMLGFGPRTTRSYGEYFIVKVRGVDVGSSINDVCVQAPDGCTQTLNWEKKQFSWSELVAWANKEKGKGTFWVAEMADVIRKVCDGKCPPVMTSTFRGRGGQAVGRIFQPNLYNVDYVEDSPVKFYFSFNQVLTPELVRGKGQLGDIFHALYESTRLRWEIIEPYFIKISSLLPSDEQGQMQLMEHVINGLNVIEEYSERHKILEDIYNVFLINSNLDLKKLIQLIEMRKSINNNLAEAAQAKRFEEFIMQLSKLLLLNMEMTEILGEEYLNQINDDHKKLKTFLALRDENEKPLEVKKPRKIAHKQKEINKRTVSRLNKRLPDTASLNTM